MSKRASDGELNDQQERFCREYIVDLNATQAAIRAGYSAKTAQEQASRLLSNVITQRRIQALMDERSKETGITATNVLEKIYEIASVDPAEAFDENGHLLPVREMPARVRRALAGFEIERDTKRGNEDDESEVTVTSKIKWWDKNRALENLGRHLRLFADKLEIEDKTGLAEKLAKARKRSGR